MPTATAVATELHKLADSIAKGGETEVEQPYVLFSYCYKFNDGAKDQFLDISRILPRPLQKNYNGDQLELKYETPAIMVKAYIERSKVCRMVKEAQPAEYECEPLLSADEENVLAVEKESDEIPF